MKAIKPKQILKVVIAAAIATVFLRVFVIDSFIVSGDSMSPGILEGDYVFIDRISYKFQELKRGDIIVVQSRDRSERIIKRIIGLPNERILISNLDGNVHIKTEREGAGEILAEDYLNFPYLTPNTGIEEIKLDPQEYFVLGDNRFVSIDSRELGPVDKWDIKGRVFFTIQPKLLNAKLFR